MSTYGSRVLCLGEAMVDLIGERHGATLPEIRHFAPHLGGAAAGVAVCAARLGARVTLAGAAGDDRWGRWLAERLRDEQLDDAQFSLVGDAATQLAFVAVDADGETTRALYPPPAATGMAAVPDGVLGAARDADGLVIGASTLAQRDERAVIMRARAQALEHDRPVIVDCRLELDRWSSRADAAASANACVPGALLVCAGLSDAELMTGEGDAERAAVALRKAGAKAVVISAGEAGAIMRGPLRADAPARRARVLSTLGAEGAVIGTLVARLALSGFYLPAAAAALREAVAAGSAACERWGALD